MATNHRRKPAAPKPPGVVRQVRIALARKQRLAATLGAVLGGSIPAATYTLAHHEWSEWLSVLTVLIAGGLVFSAPNAWQWARSAFGCPWKALGFIVLLEGVMITSTIGWLGASALAVLVLINGVATGTRLATGRSY
jgi:hypothetical protein